MFFFCSERKIGKKSCTSERSLSHIWQQLINEFFFCESSHEEEEVVLINLCASNEGRRSRTLSESRTVTVRSDNTEFPASGDFYFATYSSVMPYIGHCYLVKPQIDVVVPAVSSQVRSIHQYQPDGTTTSHGNSRRAIRSEKYYIWRIIRG